MSSRQSSSIQRHQGWRWCGLFSLILAGLMAFGGEASAEPAPPGEVAPSQSASPSPVTAAPAPAPAPAGSDATPSSEPPAAEPPTAKSGTGADGASASQGAVLDPAPQAAAPAPLPPVQPGPSAVPHDLSPWGMFMAADIVVKAVMIGLALASVLTWTVWIAKTVELSSARRSLRHALSGLSQSASLAEAGQRIGQRDRYVRMLIDEAELELRLSSEITDKEGIRERVGTRLQQAVAQASSAMNSGTGLLATIGATAPFVGLFGTVWGIMNSFIGISKSQTTNLAIVAPGIAEALLATAIGLIAAIPAVIIYNTFSRSISAYKALLADAAAEVMRHVSRDLDRGRKIDTIRAAAE